MFIKAGVDSAFRDVHTSNCAFPGTTV